jgi:hypothetical protein
MMMSWPKRCMIYDLFKLNILLYQMLMVNILQERKSFFSDPLQYARHRASEVQFSLVFNNFDNNIYIFLNYFLLTDSQLRVLPFCSLIEISSHGTVVAEQPTGAGNQCRTALEQTIVSEIDS